MKLNVLVIEDNPDDADLLIRMWQTRVPGCHLTLARSFRDVQKVFSIARDFHCICLDMRLIPDDSTGLRSLELCRQKAQGVLIVVVSGSLEQRQYDLFNSLGGIYACNKGMEFLDLEPLFKLLASLR